MTGWGPLDRASLVRLADPRGWPGWPTRRVLIGLAVLALVPRLAFLLAVRPWAPAVERDVLLVDDPITYHRLAVTLLEHGRYAESADSPPTAFRTPLYPWLASRVYAVTGPHPWALVVAQSMLDVGACLWLYFGLARLFSPPAATAAAALYALDPFVVFYDMLPLTDSLFVFCLIALLAALGFMLPRPATTRGAAAAALGGLALGAATLARPPSQYLPFLIVPFLLVYHRRTLRRAVALAACFAAAFLLVLAPWALRNQRVFGHVLLSTAGPYQLLILDAAPIVAAERGISSAAAERALLDEADAAMRVDGVAPERADEWTRGEYYRRVATGHLRKRPLAFAQAWARGTFNLFVNVNTSGFARVLGRPAEPFDMNAYRNPVVLARGFFTKKSGFATGLALALGMWLLFGYLNLLVGVVRRFRIGERGPMLLLLAIAGYFLVIGGAGSGVRYKLPALPFLLGFAGYGLVSIWLSTRRSRART